MQVRNSIVWRMLAWFLLLALIPLGAVMIFVQRQVNQTVFNIELQAAVKEARLLASESSYHLDAFAEHTQVYHNDRDTAFVLGADNIYREHTDPSKAGTAASNDFSADVLHIFFSSENGSVDNSESDQISGSSRFRQPGCHH